MASINVRLNPLVNQFLKCQTICPDADGQTYYIVQLSINFATRSIAEQNVINLFECQFILPVSV